MDTNTDASWLLLDATSHPRTKDYGLIPLRIKKTEEMCHTDAYKV